MVIENIESGLLAAGFSAAVVSIILISAVVFLLLSLLVYIYTSVAIYTLATKLKAKYAWLAWVPIARLALVAMLAKQHWAWVFSVFLNVIPFIGSIAFLGVNIWLWWHICERRKFGGPLSLLQLIPGIGYLILVGIVAWAKE